MMADVFAFLGFVVITLFGSTSANTHHCLCNHGNQQDVYLVPDTRGSVVGTLEATKCVTVYITSPDRQFYSILHGNQIAYVLKSSIVSVLDEHNCSSIVTEQWTTTTIATTTSVTTTTAAPIAGCRHDWTKLDTYCFLFFNHNPMSWTSAQHYCQLNGGHLAVVDSQQKQTAMINYMNQHSLHVSSWWIGASALSNNGHWAWSSSSGQIVPINYSYWDEGEPDTDSQCVAMQALSNYHWHDRECSSTFNFVCESEPVTNTNTPTSNVPTAPHSPYCDNGWWYHRSSCYLFKTESTDKISWHDAQTACLSDQSRLLVLSSSAEETFIQNTLKTLNFSPSGSMEDSELWLGGTDVHHEGVWEWFSGTSYSQITAYTNWRHGEPSNSNNEDCLAIVVDNRHGWNDEDCQTKLRYICEKRRYGEL